jgi:hypothetical protein
MDSQAAHVKTIKDIYKIWEGYSVDEEFDNILKDILSKE